MVSASGCGSRVLNALESQIEICARNVPAIQFFEPSWQCARSVTGRMGSQTACDLNVAPGYLQSCLRNAGYIAQSYITPAVNCVKNAISSGICC